MSLRGSPNDDPFDWAPREDPAARPAQKLYKVAELTRVIKTRLEDLGRVAVEGEVTRVMQASSGHLYFELKDLDAKISCTIWKSQVASAVRFPLKEGMQVVAHGKLDVYAPRGTYSLNVAKLEQAGLGAQLAKLEELKARLKSEGWFDRHRPLPKMPRIVGVVTSRDGAAFQDFLRTRSLRWPLYPVRLAHTLVQGPAAAAEIAAAIARLDASGVDVIVVCRGGGSLEDLWSFNELAVLEAIRNASVPVVSGIGHETDVTLADLVADHRAHTPTDAAQTVIPDRAALVERLERAGNHLLEAIDMLVVDREQRLARAANSPTLRDPKWILDVRRQRLVAAGRAMQSNLAARLARARSSLDRSAVRLQRQSPVVVLERMSARVERLAPRLDRALQGPLELAQQKLALAERSLVATSPFNVLARGYSITRRVGDKTPLGDANAVKPGEKLETRLASGVVISTVERAQDA